MNRVGYRQFASNLGISLRSCQSNGKIVDIFVCRGYIEDNKGGDNTRSARADDVSIYMEFCITTNPAFTTVKSKTNW